MNQRESMNFNNVFFIGVAGTGMSALAQYLAGSGVQVSGSDRYFGQGGAEEIRHKLEQEGVRCFPQDGSGISPQTDLVVVSTAIEDTVPEVQKARALNIPVIRRSELLAKIAATKRTIAVGGTSGKSTTSAMLFDILKEGGKDPGIISGAGLVSIIKTGKIGNAWVGGGEWLIIEADESDGSIVQYKPEIGLLLNVDKDHQELDELQDIFSKFRDNTTGLFITNRSNRIAAGLSTGAEHDFAVDGNQEAGYVPSRFTQEGMSIRFDLLGVPFRLNTLGAHNMENAVAAVAVAHQLGISPETCARALSTYEGIYRRHQLLGIKHGVTVIDDYAHNPVKCAASIRACQPVAPKVVAWFQPHGYGPTRFLRNDFVNEIAGALRPEDEIWMSEIFYAGGSAVKDISAADLIDDIRKKGRKAYFVSDRERLPDEIKSHLSDPCVLLLMGARDPALESFGKRIFEKI